MRRSTILRALGIDVGLDPAVATVTSVSNGSAFGREIDRGRDIYTYIYIYIFIYIYIYIYYIYTDLDLLLF
jgi:hypothetical protein